MLAADECAGERERGRGWRGLSLDVARMVHVHRALARYLGEIRVVRIRQESHISPAQFDERTFEEPSTAQLNPLPPPPPHSHILAANMPGVSVRDVPADKFINAYAAFLKRQGKLPIPGP
jgi:hypothetical protein